jgi:hypothetical protein
MKFIEKIEALSESELENYEKSLEKEFEEGKVKLKKILLYLDKLSREYGRCEEIKGQQ